MYYYLVYRNKQLLIESDTKQIVFTMPAEHHYGWKLWTTSKCYVITGYDKYVFLDLQFQEITCMRDKYSDVCKVLEFCSILIVVSKKSVDFLYNWISISTIQSPFHANNIVVNSQRMYLYTETMLYIIYPNLTQDSLNVIWEKVIGKYIILTVYDEDDKGYTKKYYIDTTTNEIEPLNYDTIIPIQDKCIMVKYQKPYAHLYIDNRIVSKICMNDIHYNILCNSYTLHNVGGHILHYDNNRISSISYNNKIGIAVSSYYTPYTDILFIDIKDKYVLVRTQLYNNKCYIVIDGNLNILRELISNSDEEYLAIFEVIKPHVYHNELSDIDIVCI